MASWRPNRVAWVVKMVAKGNFRRAISGTAVLAIHS